MSNKEIDQKFLEQSFIDSCKPITLDEARNNPAEVWEEVSVCPHCEAETVERFSGDEGFTFCSDGCGCLEGDRLVTKYRCPDCEELCDEEKCDCQKKKTYNFVKFMPYYHGVTIKAVSLIEATKILFVQCGSDWNLTDKHKLQSITK